MNVYEIKNSSVLSYSYIYPLDYDEDGIEWPSVKHYIEGKKVKGTVLEEKIRNIINLQGLLTQTIIREDDFLKTSRLCNSDTIIKSSADWSEEIEVFYLHKANSYKLKHIQQELPSFDYFKEKDHILNGRVMFACYIENKIRKNMIEKKAKKLKELLKNKTKLLKLNILQTNLIYKNLKLNLSYELSLKEKLLLISLLFRNEY